MNMIVFHYLEYINKNFELKENILKEKLEAKMMNQHYQDMKDQYLETRMLMHDFKNHMYTMSIAYQNKEEGLANEIMNQFIDQCNNVKIKYLTGSNILDIILKEKGMKAETLGIKFNFTMDDVTLDWIKEFDMITIFGNLLDNAIEANDDISINNKYIKLAIYQKYATLIIQQSNSCKNSLVSSKNNMQSTKSGHFGVGLQNIKKAIESYDGLFDIAIEDDVCNILLYLLK